MPGEMADGGGRSLTERDNGVLMMEQAEIAQYKIMLRTINLLL
jgi:hypothetical protein